MAKESKLVKQRLSRRFQSNALLHRSGLRRCGGTSAPILCLYPLDCSDSEIIAVGGTGAIPANDATYQDFTYVTAVGNGMVHLAGQSGYTSSTHTPTPNTGKRVFEVAITSDMSPSETGFLTIDVLTLIDSGAGIRVAVVVTGGGIFGSHKLSGDLAGYIGVWVDYDTGDYKLYNGPTEVLSHYTTDPIKSNPYPLIRLQANNTVISGAHVNIIFRTSKSDLLGTYPEGTTTLCGEIL